MDRLDAAPATKSRTRDRSAFSRVPNSGRALTEDCYLNFGVRHRLQSLMFSVSKRAKRSRKQTKTGIVVQRVRVCGSRSHAEAS